jgi:hypothetical protein
MSHKLKPPPPTFYICDQKLPCSHENPICGEDCKHIADISHAAYKEHPRFKRHKDGSQWEVERS